MSDELFLLALVVVAVLAGGVASVSGFGIGSILTPLLALEHGTKLAVAAISIPHLMGTALRFWRLRAHIDRRVLASFGVASAGGGLIGALLHVYFRSPVPAVVLGALLVFAGLMQLTGIAARMRFRGPWAWFAGAASGGFGGLVGNQGGIRSAALLGFGLPKEATNAPAAVVCIRLLVGAVFLSARPEVLVPRRPGRRPLCQDRDPGRGGRGSLRRRVRDRVRRAPADRIADPRRRRHHDHHHAGGDRDDEGPHSPRRRLLEDGARGSHRLRHAAGVVVSPVDGGRPMVRGCQARGGTR